MLPFPHQKQENNVYLRRHRSTYSTGDHKGYLDTNGKVL